LCEVDLVVALQITIYSDDVQCSVKRKFGLDELKIFYKQKPFLSQPHFEASVRMRLALPKVGTWSPLGLPKLQKLQGSKHLSFMCSLYRWKGLEV
jgi:hypothetical protein